jgi:hypothetical protein
MKNLAGVKDADKYIKEELYLAGIETIHIGGTVCSEVPYTIIGRIGHWILTRAWYYWVASVERREDGLPLNIALKLYETPYPTEKGRILGEIIRSGGAGGCSSPADYTSQPVYNEELDKKLMELGYEKKYSEILKADYIPISVGEVAELCNSSKLIVDRYVNCYHIDDQIGLNEFSKFIMNSGKQILCFS